MARNIERSAERFVRREEKLVRYEWNHYRTFLIILIVLLTSELYVTGLLKFLLDGLGNYGYLSGFVSGFLFTYGITTPFAIASFFVLAETLNIWVLVLLGTIGGTIGEYFIYEFSVKNADKCIRFYKSKGIRLPKVGSSLLRKLSPLIAGIIIASPIPDEFVAVLFGIEKYKLRDFLIMTFFFKFIGILLIVGLERVF